MRENPRLLWGAAAPRLTVVEPVDGTAEPCHRRGARAFSLIALVLGVAYLVWLGRLVLASRGSPDIFFFCAEFLSFLLLCLLTYSIWRCLKPLPEEPEPKTQCLRGHLRALLRRTFGNHQDHSQGCPADYLSSPGSICPGRWRVPGGGGPGPIPGISLPLPTGGRFAPGQDSKSGNLNFGVSRSRGELILVLDADQVPAPDILDRLIGFFQSPQVGFVQSKQDFFLPEGDPFYNSDKVFYEAIQLNNGQANAVISCGSGVVYRRRALEEMGGIRLLEPAGRFHLVL